MPPLESIENYEYVVSSYHNRIETNDEEIVTLASLRDTLLPKLISGELRVPDAEKIVEVAS